LQRQDAAGVLVDEEKFVLQGREALAQARASPVVDGKMCGRESRRHSQRSAAVDGQRRGFRKRRAFLTRRIRELMPSQGSEVHAYVAENAERAVETFSGVAFGTQRSDVRVSLIAQGVLDVVTDAHRARSVFLSEVELLELRVHLHERCPDPVLEGFRVVAHGRERPRGVVLGYRPMVPGFPRTLSSRMAPHPSCAERWPALPRLCKTRGCAKRRAAIRP